MSTPEISDEELERRMRNKLLGGEKPRAPGLTAVEQRIAESLLGRDNTARLQHRRPDAGRFRPTPVRVHYEYYWVDGGDYSMGGYRINRVENGRQIDHDWSPYDRSLEDEIAALRKKGFTVREIRMGLPIRKEDRKARPTSMRSSILNSLKDFRL